MYLEEQFLEDPPHGWRRLSIMGVFQCTCKGPMVPRSHEGWGWQQEARLTARTREVTNDDQPYQRQGSASARLRSLTAAGVHCGPGSCLHNPPNAPATWVILHGLRLRTVYCVRCLLEESARVC